MNVQERQNDDVEWSKYVELRDELWWFDDFRLGNQQSQGFRLGNQESRGFRLGNQESRGFRLGNQESWFDHKDEFEIEKKRKVKRVGF